MIFHGDEDWWQVRESNVGANKSYFILILFRAHMAIQSRSFKSMESLSLSLSSRLSIAKVFPVYGGVAREGHFHRFKNSSEDWNWLLKIWQQTLTVRDG